MICRLLIAVALLAVSAHAAEEGSPLLEASAARFLQARTMPEAVQLPDGTTVHTSVEAVAGTVDGAAEKEAVLNYLERELAANPDAQVTIYVAGDPEAPKGGVFKRFGRKFREWFFKPKHYRATFALSRFLVETSVATFTIVFSRDVPVAVALPVGLVMGAMSGSFQYWNKQWQSFILTSGILRKVFRLPATGIGRLADHFESLLKWFGVGVAYDAATKLTMWAMGLSPDPTFMTAAHNVVLTALLCLAGEFPWGFSIAKITDWLKAKHKDWTEQKVQLYSDLAVLGLSATGAIATIANLMKFQYADVAMVGVAGTGVILYLGTLKLLGKPLPPPEAPAQKSATSCGRLLSGASAGDVRDVAEVGR